jgi:hypothetical protein
LGVTVYAGDTAQSKYGGHTYLATLESLAAPGVGSATNGLEGDVIFQEPTSGLSIRLKSIDEVAGTADISIAYTGKPENPIPTPLGFTEGIKY